MSELVPNGDLPLRRFAVVPQDPLQLFNDDLEAAVPAFGKTKREHMFEEMSHLCSSERTLLSAMSDALFGAKQ